MKAFTSILALLVLVCYNVHSASGYTYMNNYWTYYPCATNGYCNWQQPYLCSFCYGYSKICCRPYYSGGMVMGMSTGQSGSGLQQQQHSSSPDMQSSSSSSNQEEITIDIPSGYQGNYNDLLKDKLKTN
ncbi:hypothetical protein Trydic_g1917 [Trypoxylus dichotomus]